MNVPETSFSPRPQARLWLTLALILLAAGRARAQAEAPPDGLRWGPWIVKPSLYVDYTGDDNVFRRADSNNPVSDRVTTVVGRVDAALPFRNSLLNVAYQASDYSYAKQTELGKELSQDFELGLDLRFASGDRLRLTESFSRGFTDVQRIAEGDDLVFEGEPYDFNELRLELDRSVSGTRGYYIRLAHRALSFDAVNFVSFFDYRGLTWDAEYREPVRPTLWVFGAYGGRRFKHFDPNTGATTEPFRREVSDQVHLGLRGVLGRRQPFVAKLGYGRLDYELVDSSRFEGLVGEFRWQLSPGEATRVTVGANRRALPSFFNTYYLLNEATVRVERDVFRYSSAGLNVRYSLNDYGDETFCGGTTTCLRSDDIRSGELYFLFAPHPRFGMRLSASHVRRDSNAEQSVYDNTIVSVGVVVGWFE